MAGERDPELEALLAYLRDERGFDFTGYKRPSLTRRIAKRMHDAKIETMGDYRHHLERHPEELAALFDTILINVTSFFRDAPVWDYLAEAIVPRILAAREADPIRIWSTGCATGEEAFTLAMVFAEAMGTDDFRQRVKIYATDVDDDALNVGRHATYTAAQIENVPSALRGRYFETVNGGHAFRGDLRRCVIFGRHDLVQDPPISRIDLLASRNTLMYFDSETQRAIVANFHFALRDDGFLFLGKSELLVARSPLFKPVEVRKRLFAKVPSAARDRNARPAPSGGERVAEAPEHDSMREAGFDTAPVAQIVIDRGGRVVVANMQARLLFGLSHRDLGTLLQDLEVSYRPIELRSRIEQAYADRHVIALRDVEWRAGEELRVVDVQIAPLTSQTGELLGVGVSFADVTRAHRLQDELQTSKREVETAYEELQSTVEELETTNEELQSTNEELETTNEELQSTNEELETMNEELQSTNEELETMNDELQLRTDELNDANSFLEAVLSSLTAAVVVLDRELRVQAWNGAARDLWGLRDDEAVGQHLLNLDIGLPLEELRSPIRAAIGGDTVEGVTLRAINRRGRPVLVRLRFAPLASDGVEVRGAIVTMDPSDQREQ